MNLLYLGIGHVTLTSAIARSHLLLLIHGFTVIMFSESSSRRRRALRDTLSLLLFSLRLVYAR